MFKRNIIGLNIIITLLGLIALPTKVMAANFSYGLNETEIFTTNFESNSGWVLNGTTINNGKMYGTSAWGTASYAINPVNLHLGNVFLYWSATLPTGARTEREKYYVGLQYADNDPVCYNSQTNQIVGTPPCTGSSVVDENAELRVEIRPRDNANAGNRYHRLYIDPDFDPVNNYSPASTRLDLPTFQPKDFRLQISKASSNTYTALLSFWNNTDWVSFNPKSSSEQSPLLINGSDWIDDNGQIESPVTFEAINLQFRKGSSLNSEIKALALTQILPQLQQSVTVPESSSTIGLPLLMGFGILLKRQKQKR